MGGWGEGVEGETRGQGDKETRRQGDKETRRQGEIIFNPNAQCPIPSNYQLSTNYYQLTTKIYL